MVFIKNNMPDLPFKESIKDKLVVLKIAASQSCVFTCYAYESICDKGNLVI